MSFFTAIILGLVQGITEFLPISSSAHVQIAEAILGQNQSSVELTAFIATIQLGTEAAVLIYFWKDIVRIVRAWGRSGFTKSPTQDAKLGWLIIIGSIPVVIAGLLFKHQIETNLRSLWVIAITLIIFGLVLGLADIVGKKTKPISDLTVKHGILYGLGQMLAVIPGVSRSGGTITVGLLLGYSRAAAARYSFLLAIPAVLASGVLEFVTTYESLNSDDLVAVGVATLVAFVSGYLVIKFFLQYLSKGSFAPFVIWRVIVGMALLIALSTGVLGA